jgi:serine/threonine protein kinase HipA of HipAB toxin-antitoxin module
VVYGEIKALLPETAVVFAGDAPAFHYHTGLPALSAPNEPPAVLRQMAQRYGATHLLLDGSPPPALAALYAGEMAVASIHLIAEVDNLRLYELRGE